jgi:hypothetical protein
VTGRKARTCKHLQGDFKEMRGYFKLKEEALDYILWRTRFESCHGHVVRQTDRQASF